MPLAQAWARLLGWHRFNDFDALGKQFCSDRVDQINCCRREIDARRPPRRCAHRPRGVSRCPTATRCRVTRVLRSGARVLAPGTDRGVAALLTCASRTSRCRQKFKNVHDKKDAPMGRGSATTDHTPAQQVIAVPSGRSRRPASTALAKWRSCPREWCSSAWSPRSPALGRNGQSARVGRVTVGSSLEGAMVSRVR